MITIFNDFLNERYVNKFNFEIGKSYEYDELPEQTKLEIDSQNQDNYEDDVYDYTYKFTLLQPEDTEGYLMKTFDPYNLGDLLETPHIKDLINDIKNNGLDYPSVGFEGNHRALVHWFLKKPLPYLEMIKKENINESLRDKLKGKSDKELIKTLNGLDDTYKIRKIIKYKLPYDLFPDDLIINGDLDCSDYRLTSLPDNLTIKGYLYCENNLLTKLPNNLIVYGSLHCGDNKLTSFPDDLIVYGSIYCSGNQLPHNIKKPEGVKGEIYN